MYNCLEIHQSNVRNEVLIERNSVKMITPVDIETIRLFVRRSLNSGTKTREFLLRSMSLTDVCDLIPQMHHVVTATKFYSVHSKDAGHE